MRRRARRRPDAGTRPSEQPFAALVVALDYTRAGVNLYAHGMISWLAQHARSERVRLNACVFIAARGDERYRRGGSAEVTQEHVRSVVLVPPTDALVSRRREPGSFDVVGRRVALVVERRTQGRLRCLLSGLAAVSGAPRIPSC